MCIGNWPIYVCVKFGKVCNGIGGLKNLYATKRSCLVQFFFTEEYFKQTCDLYYCEGLRVGRRVGAAPCNAAFQCFGRKSFKKIQTIDYQDRDKVKHCNLQCSRGRCRVPNPNVPQSQQWRNCRAQKKLVQVTFQRAHNGSLVRIAQIMLVTDETLVQWWKFGYGWTRFKFLSPQLSNWA